MIFSKEVTCCICKKVFCCVKCREKHEVKSHKFQIKKVDQDQQVACVFCTNGTLVLKQNLSEDAVKGICENHFPLQCRKCSNIYSSREKLNVFSNCEKKTMMLQEMEANVENFHCDQSPKLFIENAFNKNPDSSVDICKNEHLTPISEINLRWKMKSKTFEASVTDSISSLKNVSSMNHTSSIIQPNASKLKLARTTSTPMQRLISKVKENGFDASSCHVSSIYSSSSESDISPPIRAFTVTTSPDFVKPEEKFKRGFNMKPRTKAQATVTPLRQVMSRSIQRAIAEHNSGQYSSRQMEQIFESTEKSASEKPLDLRTTPVLRRTQSEYIPRNYSPDISLIPDLIRDRKIVSQQKRNIEEIRISSATTIDDTNKLETVYESCHSVEVSTTYFVQQNQSDEKKNPKSNSLAITPKTIGVPLKKAISFDTPYVTQSYLDDTLDDEVFYTPVKDYSSVEHKTSKLQKKRTPPMFESNQSPESKKISPQHGKLWSLVSCVMRLATGNTHENRKENKNTDAPSLIKRCASFTGFLNRGKSPDSSDDLNKYKRKRTSTADGLFNAGLPNSPQTDLPVPSKRLKRIQCRQPLERMRKKCQ